MLAMKGRSCAVACWLAVSSVVAWSGRQFPPPEFIGTAVLNPAYPIATFRCPSNEWMVIEVSSDLRVWSELENVKYRGRHGWYQGDALGTGESRFYRLKIPGTSVEDAKRRWDARRPTDYQFRFREHVVLVAGGLTGGWDRRGLVIVSAGQKTVSDVEFDYGPTPDMEPPEPPAVDDLFNLLEEGASTAKSVLVRYDALHGHPSQCLIHTPGGEYLFYEYWISDFILLNAGIRGGAGRSPNRQKTATVRAGRPRLELQPLRDAVAPDLQAN